MELDLLNRPTDTELTSSITAEEQNDINRKYTQCTALCDITHPTGGILGSSMDRLKNQQCKLKCAAEKDAALQDAGVVPTVKGTCTSSGSVKVTDEAGNVKYQPCKYGCDNGQCKSAPEPSPTPDSGSDSEGRQTGGITFKDAETGKTNWLLIGGIAAGVIALGVAGYYGYKKLKK
jgi:hypothetical protein